MRKWAQKATVAALGFMSLGFVAPAGHAQSASRPATETTLLTETQRIGSRSVNVYSATVLDEQGQPVTGAVTLFEAGHPLAGAALDAQGKAAIRYDALKAGQHSVYAAYSGNAVKAPSESHSLSVTAEATAAPEFTLAIDVPGSSSAATMTIAAPGDEGTLKATVTPATGFTGFISLSCSGPPASSGKPGGTSLPQGVSCTFAPANLQITGASAATADMTLETVGAQVTTAGLSRSHSLALAVLLPGLGFLGFLGRKRKLFARAALLAMVAVIGVLGTSSCSARYRYLNHGPTFTGTIPGTYTMTITAQTSDGVTASSQSQTLTLVVQ